MKHTDFVLWCMLPLLFQTGQNCIEINILSNWTNEVIDNKKKKRLKE